MKTKVNLKAKRISETGKRIGTTLLALAMITGVCTPAITSFTQAQPVTKTKKKAKAKKKTKAKKTKSKKKKSYKAKAGTISLSPITLTEGKSKTVSVKTKSKVKWTSSNAKVASVKSISKSKVKVTAKKKGSTKVSGKAGKAKWSFTVKVKGNKKPSQKNNENNTQKANTALLDNNIKAILHECGADAGTSDIQKFARLCRWWSLNVKYDNDLANYLYDGNNFYNYPELKDKSLDKYDISNYDSNAFSNYDSNAFAAAYILELRKGICGFQAKAFKYYCDLLGVKSMCIVGKGRNHEWLHIYLDDGWYTFDPTDFAMYSSITIDDYLNTKEGQDDYDSWLKAAQRVRPNGERKFGETAEESARRLVTENAKKNHLYRLANLHAEDDGVEAGLCIGNSDGCGLRLSPYFIDNDGIYKAISDSEEKEHLTGKKYINVFLGDYL